jgi:group I intron endonuclease
MIHHIFDMSTASISEVRVVVRFMTKMGLSMGIYYFINQKNQKSYVGSTLNFYNRLGNYYYLKDTNQVIIKALTKYGLSSFTLILVFMPYASKKEVLALEQEILGTLKPEYNILTTAGSPAGWQHSVESRAKISASLTGRKLSPEHIARTSEVQRGEGNSHFNKGQSTFLIEITSSGLKLVCTFPNKARCSEALGIHRNSVTYRVKTKYVFLYNDSHCFLTHDLPSNLIS